MTNQVNLPEQLVKPLAKGQWHTAYVRLPPMAIRTEVRTFCAASGNTPLACAASIPLNEEEQGMIRLYLENLQEKY
jgi:hypothetical protein